MKSIILALDTATSFAGLALSDENTVWCEESWYADRNHTVTLLPRLNRALNLIGLCIADLGGIAVSIGPGSYTGVRIAVSVAKGLALPHNLPVVGVPTLEITAYPFQHQQLPVAAIAQAGRKRILVAHYQRVDQTWVETKEPTLTTMTQFAQALSKPTFVVGELNTEDIAELHKSSEYIAQVVDSFNRVRRPSVLAELGRLRLSTSIARHLDTLNPIYLGGPG